MLFIGFFFTPFTDCIYQSSAMPWILFSKDLLESVEVWIQDLLFLELYRCNNIFSVFLKFFLISSIELVCSRTHLSLLLFPSQSQISSKTPHWFLRDLFHPFKFISFPSYQPVLKIAFVQSPVQGNFQSTCVYRNQTDCGVSENEDIARSFCHLFWQRQRFFPLSSSWMILGSDECGKNPQKQDEKLNE